MHVHLVSRLVDDLARKCCSICKIILRSAGDTSQDVARCHRSTTSPCLHAANDISSHCGHRSSSAEHSRSVVDLERVRILRPDFTPARSRVLCNVKICNADGDWHCAEWNPPTVAVTKRKFLEAYSKPISGIYDAVLQELLVQQHLIRYKKKYQYDPVRNLLPNPALLIRFLWNSDMLSFLIKQPIKCQAKT